MKKIPHFINGQSYEGRSSRYADGFNPATGEVVSSIPLASNEDVALAVSAAKAAFPAWAETPPPSAPASSSTSRRCWTSIRTSWPSSSPANTARSSPTPSKRGHARIEVVEFACGIPHLLKGQYTDQTGGGIIDRSMRQPLAWWPASRRSTSP